MKKSIAVLIFTLLTLNVQAGSVIVHPSFNENIGENYIALIFLGKVREFPSGAQAIPVTLNVNSHATTSFNQRVLSLTNSQLKAHWAKLLFTRRGSPPKEVINDQQMMELIASNPNMIGFIEGEPNDSVKVLLQY